jgi:hypothetical protein
MVRRNFSLFAFVKRKFVANISLMLLVSIVAPWQVFADDQLFRNTKEDFSPHPYVQPDLSTGAFTYSRPITIPPGRNGMQPDIKLTYNSAGSRQDSIVGHGWSLNIPYIERLNKNGVDKLFNQDLSHSFFYSSLSGELLPISTTTAVSGSFLGFSFSTPRLSFLNYPAHFAQLDTTPTPDLSPIADSATTSLILETASIAVVDAIEQVATTSIIQDTMSTSTATLTPTQKTELDTTTTSLDIPSVIFPIDENEVSTSHKSESKEFSLENVVNPDGSLALKLGEEITAKRTLNSKHFFTGLNRAEAKNIRTEFFTNPVHYRNVRTNKLEDIDSRLTPTAYGLTMTRNSYHVALDTTETQKHLITMTHDGLTFAIDLLNAPSSAVKKGSLKNNVKERGHAALYPDLLASGIDLEVTTLDDRFIKEAVIRDASVIASTTGEYLEIPFRFTFNTPITLSGNGKTLTADTPIITSSGVTITDMNGVSTNIIPPKAISSGNATSSDQQIIPIDIAYTATTSGFIMTKRIPLSFLRDAVYPVRTDATLTFNPTLDGWVGQQPGSATWAAIRAGGGNTYDSSSANTYMLYTYHNGANNNDNWDDIIRSIFVFDTSAIG